MSLLLSLSLCSHPPWTCFSWLFYIYFRFALLRVQFVFGVLQHFGYIIIHVSSIHYIDHLRLYGKLGKGHTDYDQIGMSRCKSLTFVLELNIWKNEYLMNQNQVFFFISGWLTFPLFENIYKALLKTNSLFKRTKLIQPQFNTVNEHSIKLLPMYWLRKMHKRKDLNLGESINSILKIDSRLVIDHKWQEIHLSLLKSPFYLAVFPQCESFHTRSYLNSYPMGHSPNFICKSVLEHLHNEAYPVDETCQLNFTLQFQLVVHRKVLLLLDLVGFKIKYFVQICNIIPKSMLKF